MPSTRLFTSSISMLFVNKVVSYLQDFQMSLFASLDMTAYQVRIMFLHRLRDEYETKELKVAILEFVATCIGKQPGLTEAFFMMNHEKAKTDEKKEDSSQPKKDEECFEGILGYMADYLKTVTTVSRLLDFSPCF